MPARDMLDEGLLLQKAGVLDRAMEQYGAALAAATEPALQSEALRRQAHVHRTRCDWDKAIAAAQRSAELAAAAGLHDLIAEALNAEAAVYQSRGDLSLAAALYEQILEVTKDLRICGVALQNLAGVRATQGDVAAGERHFEAAYDCFVRAGYAWGMAHVLNNLGHLALISGRVAEAEERLHRATEEAKLVNDLELLALTRLNYADALRAQKEYARAEEAASAAVGHFAMAGNHWRRIEGLRILGDLHADRGSTDTARRFYLAAVRIAEEIGAGPEHEQLTARLAKLDTTGEP